MGKTSKWYLAQLEKKEERIKDLKEENDILRKLLFKSVGERIEQLERFRKRLG